MKQIEILKAELTEMNRELNDFKGTCQHLQGLWQHEVAGQKHAKRCITAMQEELMESQVTARTWKKLKKGYKGRLVEG